MPGRCPCCPFFDFVLRIDAEAVTLVVSVPAGAEAILDDVTRHPFTV